MFNIYNKPNSCLLIQRHVTIITFTKYMKLTIDWKTNKTLTTSQNTSLSNTHGLNKKIFFLGQNIKLLIVMIRLWQNFNEMILWDWVIYWTMPSNYRNSSLSPRSLASDRRHCSPLVDEASCITWSSLPQMIRLSPMVSKLQHKIHYNHNIKSKLSIQLTYKYKILVKYLKMLHDSNIMCTTWLVLVDYCEN